MKKILTIIALFCHLMAFGVVKQTVQVIYTDTVHGRLDTIWLDAAKIYYNGNEINLLKLDSSVYSDTALYYAEIDPVYSVSVASEISAYDTNYYKLGGDSAHWHPNKELINSITSQDTTNWGLAGSGNILSSVSQNLNTQTENGILIMRGDSLYSTDSIRWENGNLIINNYALIPCQLHVNVSKDNDITADNALVTLTAYVNETGVTYSWNSGAGSNKTYQVVAEGTYECIVSKTGCVNDTAEIFVETKDFKNDYNFELPAYTALDTVLSLNSFLNGTPVANQLAVFREDGKEIGGEDSLTWVDGILTITGRLQVTDNDNTVISGISQDDDSPGLSATNSATSGTLDYTALNAISYRGECVQLTQGYINIDATNNENVIDMIRIASAGNTYNFGGNWINITDNPTTLGTISGKILSATIGSTERISMNPRATGTTYSYFLDTHAGIDSIFDIRRNGVSLFKISSTEIKATGDIYTNENGAFYHISEDATYLRNMNTNNSIVLGDAGIGTSIVGANSEVNISAQTYIDINPGDSVVLHDIVRFKGDSTIMDKDLHVYGNIKLNGYFEKCKYCVAAYLDPDSTIVTNATTDWQYFSNVKFNIFDTIGFSFDGDTIQFNKALYDDRDSIKCDLSYSCESSTTNVNKTIYMGIFIKSTGEDYREIKQFTKKARTATADIYYPGPTCSPLPFYLKDGDKIQIRIKIGASTTTISTQGYGIYLNEE